MMAKSVLVVLTKPVEGREAEFDAWYSEVHLPEVVRLEGFVAARRFALVPDPARDAPAPLPYLAIYEVEDGMLERARRTLAETLERSKAAAREGREQELTQTDALHEERIVLWFEEIARVD
jgi:hypothetical protein